VRRVFRLTLVCTLLLLVASVHAQEGTSIVRPPLAQASSDGQSNPLLGALSQGELSPTPVELSLQAAIDLALKYNVGLLLNSKTTDQARATRLEVFSHRLPQVAATLREGRQRTNLEALGISIPGVLPTAVSVSNFDARVSVTAPIVDLQTRSTDRAAGATVKAVEWDYRSAREAVTLTTVSAYLQTVSAEASLTAAQADLETAQSLYQVARDRERAGVGPNIDTLRSQVEMEQRHLAVIEAQNSLDKQRVALLRIVGLRLQQQVVLSSRAPYKPVSEIGPDQAFSRAIAMRADYKAAEARLAAAEEDVGAARRQRTPTVSVSADIGALGTSPAEVERTWSAYGVLRVPIFTGGQVAATVQRVSAARDQRKAEADDLRTSIEQDVTDAVLDVRAAAERVDVAKATADFAQQTLAQARSRFAAGVTNNIEVVQAQESVARANSQYIDALYAHNIAKVALARAMGSAEETLGDVLAIETVGRR
jgi:outer membrane protein TolC